eukprot:6464622-Amphidinium_carterae.2
MDAYCIVAQLHGAIIRMASFVLPLPRVGAGFTPQGDKELRMSARVRRKLLAIDSAFNICRHITETSAQAFLHEFKSDLELSCHGKDTERQENIVNHTFDGLDDS